MSDKASVLDTAKRIASGEGDDSEVTLSTGIRVKLCPVSSSLVIASDPLKSVSGSPTK